MTISMMRVTVGPTALVLTRGDITQQDTDAIVNAANSSLLGGGGVDGAIHHAGGPRILEECRAIRAQQGMCPPGEAVITGGGRLKAKYVIHTVGPVWLGGSENEDSILRNAYFNSLRVAAEHNLKTVAFPSISTGAYGFPLERASRIAYETVKAYVAQHRQLTEVRFVVFSQTDYDIYSRVLRE